MPLTQLTIKNFKSIKNCDITLSELNLLIGENGTGKTNILEAISYFYNNLTNSNFRTDIFDENNRYSNEVRISLTYDFSECVKIAKSNFKEFMIYGDEYLLEECRYSGYYRTIISMADCNPDKKVRVEMSQIKGSSIQWNCSYSDRLIIKSLFPIFYIDTRNLDVNEWGYIWNILGELAKVSNEENISIKEKISTILLDNGNETSEKIKVINDIFQKANVSIKPYIARDFATNLTKVYFAGERIYQRGKYLKYYSTGTNSVKYIEILLKSIDALSRIKMKEPIILFDEPEISLHTNYLDELADAIIDVNYKLRIFLSTHSSRLTKNLIKKSDIATLYNVRLVDKYSVVNKMKKFPQYNPTTKYRVSDDHINAYFSKAVLFVEGETELELFANPYLRILFPKLKKIDVFKAMSEKPVLEIMRSKESRSNVPYLCLIDIDKVISYDSAKNLFGLKQEHIADDRKERFRYINKHDNKSIYFQHKRINAMSRKLRVHYYRALFSCDDVNYKAFIDAIHKYLLSYNIFSLSTTIEGILINDKTLSFALDFLRKYNKNENFEEFIDYWNGLEKLDQVNLLRILFNGKSDLLKDRKYFVQSNDPNIKKICELIKIGNKTSGWVSEYLDKFFHDEVAPEIDLSEKRFRIYLENVDNRKKVMLAFKNNFSELYSLIYKLCAMIKE